MKVLRVRPKHYPEVIDIDCSLESLQKEVEGPIQAVYPWDDEVADYEQNYDWNTHPLDYDLVYYSDFCHFEEV